MKLKILKEGISNKRIARYHEFDNGHVLHTDWLKVSDEEAEELARKASEEDPVDVYYVHYDDIMNPSNDNRYIKGKKYNVNQFGKYGDDGLPTIKEGFRENTKHSRVWRLNNLPKQNSQLNAGDPEKNMEIFNNATDVGEAPTGTGLAEAIKEVNLKDITDKIYINGPYSRGGVTPKGSETNIMEKNYPRNMRFKEYHKNIDGDTIEFNIVTQEPFNNNDFDIFTNEVKRAMEAIIKEINYKEPFLVNISAIDRDSNDQQKEPTNNSFVTLEFNKEEIKEEIEPKQINIRDELNKLDSTYYDDLLGIYYSLDLSLEEKKQLASMMNNLISEEDYMVVKKYLEDKYKKQIEWDDPYEGISTVVYDDDDPGDIDDISSYKENI